jgi:hypothetical protein
LKASLELDSDFVKLLLNTFRQAIWACEWNDKEEVASFAYEDAKTRLHPNATPPVVPSFSGAPSEAILGCSIAN